MGETIALRTCLLVGSVDFFYVVKRPGPSSVITVSTAMRGTGGTAQSDGYGLESNQLSQFTGSRNATDYVPAGHKEPALNMIIVFNRFKRIYRIFIKCVMAITEMYDVIMVLQAC